MVGENRSDLVLELTEPRLARTEKWKNRLGSRLTGKTGERPGLRFLTRIPLCTGRRQVKHRRNEITNDQKVRQRHMTQGGTERLCRKP